MENIVTGSMHYYYNHERQPFLSSLLDQLGCREDHREDNYSAASYSASERICNDFRFLFSLVLFSVAVVAIVIIVTLISCTKLSSPDFLVHVV